MPYYPPPATAAAGTTVVGTTVIDFGAFPGKSDTSVTVTGQTSIASDSIISAWITPVATSDHSADEHMLETIKIYVGNIVVGTGFTIYGFNSSEINENFSGMLNASQTVGKIGQGTRIYGQWTIAWSWN